MSIEEEIIFLTDKWYKYVNIDHHKDRDCHWYIEKVWSYGDEPYYFASHHGYILDEWTSPKCETEELAQTLLRNKLKNELKEALYSLKDRDDEANEWFGISQEKLNEVILELEAIK